LIFGTTAFMPELPEVETARRNLEKALKGKKIEEVKSDLKDRSVFDRQAPQAVARALKGVTVRSIHRKGKYLWLELDRRPWLVLHLGMTGDIKIRKKGQDWSGVHLHGLKKTASLKLPPYLRLYFITSDGIEVAFTDPRRFGRIRLVNDPLHEKPISELGMDPLEDFPSAGKLQAALATRKAPIKAVLLDQSVFAGVGNWVADEVLFQTEIDPHRRTNHLSLVEVTRLRRILLSVLKKAVSVGADSERYPKSWLFSHRWGKGKKAMTAQGHKIQFDTVGGRTTAWVPEIQK
jgi:formamidopyrimidine-DNA glycosylase